ncbi:MAG: hypothetical protein LC746_07855 [Acidobacteria bacterium]|nr:hypothetical protein [Acidobacteriota bacterium]
MNLKSRLLTITICAALLASVACATRTSDSNGAGGSSSSPSSGGVATTSGGVISEKDKPLDAMTKAVHAQLDAKSYRAQVDMTASNGTTSKLSIEYAAPDRYHMTTESQTNGRQFSLEYIIVGKDTYMKTNNGAWTRFPVDMSSMLTAIRNPKMLDDLAKAADVRLVGADTLDGAPALVYEYTMTNPAGMILKSTAKTWVSVADGLPRKTESESEMNGVKTKSVATLTDYNSDIKIELPTAK